MLFTRPTVQARPFPPGLLEWQVSLRAHTAHERNGAPHAGVAPLLTVRRPGVPLGVSSHSIICGILPHPSRLEAKTAEFRQIYEAAAPLGSREVYDRGLAYLRDYYRNSEDFDHASLSTLLGKDSPAVQALRADGRCALVFYVFDLQDRSEVGRFRCLQVNCEAEVLERGPVFDNVWWHNTLFHGKAEEHVVIHFRHQSTYDTRFGSFETLVD
ncbi:MAG TPA: hypothetical protein VEL74_15570 [Thermoanaerobaculia bacterium]|nr:hypothetical protein [Thermoanaerobaculia bacterium]